MYIPEPKFEMIPESKMADEALNDIALRVQQTLIALEVYKNKLNELGSDMPGLHIDGYALSEIPLYWGGMKDPSKLADNTRRSVTFTLLSALDMHRYVFEGFITQICKQYYKLDFQGGPEFMNDEVFTMLTTIDMSKLTNYDALEDIRRITKNIREMKKSQGITIPEYFELYQKFCQFITSLSVRISSDLFTKQENERKARSSENEGKD